MKRITLILVLLSVLNSISGQCTVQPGQNYGQGPHMCQPMDESRDGWTCRRSCALTTERSVFANPPSSSWFEPKQNIWNLCCGSNSICGQRTRTPPVGKLTPEQVEDLKKPNAIRGTCIIEETKTPNKQYPGVCRVSECNPSETHFPQVPSLPGSPASYNFVSTSCEDGGICCVFNEFLAYLPSSSTTG